MLFGFRVTGPIVLLSLFLLACQPTAPVPKATGEAAPPAAKPAETVTATVALPGVMIETMHPYAHSTTQLYPTWKHVIEPLVEWDWGQREIVPILAESWSNPDANTWEFQLKRGVKFHDGSDFTADDVVHSYTRIKEDPASLQASSLANVVEIEAVDPHTLRLRTGIPDAALLFRLAQRFITSQSAYDRLGPDEADRQAIGTGPYRFKEWVPAQRFVLERNPEYGHSPRNAVVDEVVFRNIPEAEPAITALMNREVDVISNIPPESAGRVTGVARVESARTINIMFLGMHQSVSELQNKLVRQAVNYAIDRESLTEGVLQGFAYPLDAPVGPDQYGYSPDLQPKYNHDPDKARELLAEAGYPDGLEADFLIPVGQYNKVSELAQAIAQMLEEVGIRTRLQTQDQATGFANIRDGNVGIYIFGRGSVVDPSEYLQQYFRTGVTHRLDYSHPEIDAALDAQQAEFDPAQRLALLRQTMSMLLDEAPVAWLFQYQGLQGVNNRFDFTSNPGEDVYAWDLKPR